MTDEQQVQRTRVRGSVRHRAARGLSAAAVIAVVAGAISARVPAAEAPSQSAAAIDTVELAAFVDSFMTARMNSDRFPGAGFVFVKDGRVSVIRGYGLADVCATCVSRLP